jgi:hypothetical protein
MTETLRQQREREAIDKSVRQQREREAREKREERRKKNREEAAWLEKEMKI